MAQGYRGRFAPTPSGPLHFGSLVCALASYLDAKTQHGVWLLRIDDLDLPRVASGAVNEIFRALEAYGLHWDEPVRYQSQHSEAYAAAFERLKEQAWVYPCACSRREIADSRLNLATHPIYPGTCRHGMPPEKTLRAWRVHTHGVRINFQDRVQGQVSQNLELEIGDFVLRRADGSFAYQLASVVDDAAMQISDVVRGADLIDSTARQCHLQSLLALPQARYMHLPVALNDAGEKLSKQTLAPPLDWSAPQPTLMRALDFLGQRPARELSTAKVEDLLSWACAHWDVNQIPKIRGLFLDDSNVTRKYGF